MKKFLNKNLAKVITLVTVLSLALSSTAMAVTRDEIIEKEAQLKSSPVYQDLGEVESQEDQPTNIDKREAVKQALEKRVESGISARTIGVAAVEAEYSELYCGEETEVTVFFNSNINATENIIISVTNGAKIKVKSKDDVEYRVNNRLTDFDFIGAPTASTITIKASNLLKNKLATLTFVVEAPTGSDSFDISAKSGFAVGFTTVDVSSEILLVVPPRTDDATEFSITGNVKIKGTSISKGSVMFEITNPAGEIVKVLYGKCDSNGNFRVDNVLLDEQPGIYTVSVWAYDGRYNFIGTTSKQIILQYSPITATYYSIYSSNIKAELNNPAPNQYVIYNKISVSGSGALISNPISSKVNLKYTGRIDKAEFVFTTNKGTYKYNANQAGNSFSANFTGFSTTSGFSVYLEVTRAGVVSRIKVGEVVVYVDPAGYIYDVDTGERIEGAEVTLYYRHTTLTDNLWEIWDQDSSQPNPVITTADGTFEWLVQDADYEVRVYHSDYHAEGEYYSTLNDPEYGILTVPPERLDVYIGLQKPLELAPVAN